MKLPTSETSTKQAPSATGMKVARMGFDPSSHAFLMDALTNLYSNPELAVLREYPSNGIDSHIAAGVTRPVELTMPTHDNPNFIVKDFGVGMSAEEIENIYSMYGASTKRNSNEQIGAFGLGAKSALTITPHFTFTSIKDGEKNVVLVMKGEDGVGDFKFLSTTETTEGNGVEVVIPISNLAKFRQEATKFFRSVHPDTILVDGERIEDTIYNETNWSRIGDAGWFHTSAFLGTTTTNPHYGTGVRVKYGPVMYDLDNSTGNLFPRYGGFYNVNASFIVLDIPIGDLDLTPSREGLRYSDRTVSRLKEAFVSYTSAIQESMTALLESFDSRIDAARFYTKTKKAEIQIPNEWHGETIPNELSFPQGLVVGGVAQDGKKTIVNNIIKQELVNIIGAYSSAHRYVVEVEDPYQRDILFKNIKDYMKSENLKELRVFSYLKGQVSDVWLTQTSPSLDYQTVVNAGIEYRREQRRIAREKKLAQNNGTLPAADRTRYGVSYFVYDTRAENKNDNPQRVSIEDIEPDALYITEDESGWGNFVRAIRSNTHEFGRYQRSRLNLIDGLVKDRQVIILPSSLSFERFQKYLPNATKLVDHMVTNLKNWIAKLSPVEYAYVYDHYQRNLGSSYTLFQILAVEDRIGDIKDEVTRKRAIVSADGVLASQLQTLQVLQSYEFHEGNALRSALKNGFLTANKYSFDYEERYPLLGKAGNLNGVPAEHLIDYINLADKTRKTTN